MRIEERVARSSREHYALFALDRYADHHETPVPSDRLHAATGEFFPDEGALLDALMELATRGLVENTPDGWALTSPGSVAANRRGKPESPPPWAEPEPANLREATEDPEVESELGDLVPAATEWTATDVTGVYLGPGTEAGEAASLVELAATVREALPEALRDEWNLVCSVGPYRFYDVAYAVVSEQNAIVLDAYSVRPNVEPWADRVARRVVAEVLEHHKWDADAPGAEA